MSGILKVLEKNGISTKQKTAREFSAPCPWCSGRDRFCIWPETGRYWCRRCNKSGDTIQLCRDWLDMSFQEAAEVAGQAYKVRRV